MSRSKNTLAQTLKTWDTLNTTIKSVLPDLPTAAKDQADFEASIARVRSLSMTQESLTGQGRDATKSRLAEESTARELYDRLASHLRAKFGSKSDLLLQFAVKPRRQGRRKKATPPTDPQSPQPEVRATPSASPSKA